MDLTLITAAIGIILAGIFYVKGIFSGKKSEVLKNKESEKENILHEVEKKQKEIKEKQTNIKQQETEIENTKKDIQKIVESENEVIKEIMKTPKAKDLLKEFYKW